MNGHLTSRDYSKLVESAHEKNTLGYRIWAYILLGKYKEILFHIFKQYHTLHDTDLINAVGLRTECNDINVNCYRFLQLHAHRIVTRYYSSNYYMLGEECVYIIDVISCVTSPTQGGAFGRYICVLTYSGIDMWNIWFNMMSPVSIQFCNSIFS